MASDRTEQTFSLMPRDAGVQRTGMTSVIDFGPDGFGWTGPRGLADLLDCAAEYIDYAKIYAMNALLIPKETVARIVRQYREAGVMPYSGGILFEHAERSNAIEGYIAHLKSLGIQSLEMSENYLTLSDGRRRALIARFCKEGFRVIYEFGRKNPEEAMDLDLLDKIVTESFGEGAEHVILEQSEVDVVARDAPDRLDALKTRPWFDKVFIEADPYRFPRQHVELIRQFGSDVNLANVTAGQALRLEGLRRGVGRAVDYAMFQIAHME